MTRLFAALGVDYDQWRALTIVALKLDFRTTSLRPQTSATTQSSNVVSMLVLQGVFYTMFGAGMAALVWVSRDLFLTGTLLMTFVLFIVGAAILLDHNSAMTSPLDYPILGFRPVSSRTYFAARLTNALIYTTGLTTITAWLPAGALFIRHGVLVGLAGLLAFYGWSISLALLILLGYAWMLRLVGPDTVKRALSYVQLVMSFAVYGGYIVIPQLFGKALLSGVSVKKTVWLLFYPGTWFASYLELAAGKTGPMEVAPAVCSLLLLAAVAGGAGSRLSLEYSERLGALTTAAQKRRRAASTKPGFLFRAGEARAIALLVRSQFRNDNKFRLGVLGIVPLTLLYLFMALRDNSLGDPFARTAGSRASYVTMAMLLFPSMLKAQLSRSDSFRAAWVFFATPCDRMRLVRASTNVLTAFFLLPYVVLVGATLSYFIGHVTHVAVHVALIGLISYLALEVSVLLDPELPFSRPPQVKTANTGLFMGLMFVFILVAMLIQGLSPLLYASRPATIIAFVMVALACVLVDRLTRARVEARTKLLELEG